MSRRLGEVGAWVRGSIVNKQDGVEEGQRRFAILSRDIDVYGQLAQPAE